MNNNFLILVIVILIIYIIKVQVKAFIKKRQSNKKYLQNKSMRDSLDIKNPKNQIKFINNKRIRLRKEKVVNNEASKVLELIEVAVKSLKYKYRICAETSLGAFVRTNTNYGTEEERNRAFSSLAGKRVDFLIVDLFGNAILAIEYHGSGHGTDEDSTLRDQVKKQL